MRLLQLTLSPYDTAGLLGGNVLESFSVRNSVILSPCHLVTLPPCHASQRVISGRKVRCVPTEAVLVGLGVLLGVGVESFVAPGVAVVATGVAVD